MTFFKNKNVMVMCIYLNYKEQTEQTTLKLIGSLLRQLVEDQISISDNIQMLYEHHTNRSTHPTLDELVKVLQSELSAFSRAFVVIDALDECQDHESRVGLLEILLSLGGNLQLMVTSHDLPVIAQHFQATDCLEIQTQDADVRIYVEHRINAAPKHIQQLKTIIVSKVVENVAGM